jgi:hypothetical protein
MVVPVERWRGRKILSGKPKNYKNKKNTYK